MNMMTLLRALMFISNQVSSSRRAQMDLWRFGMLKRS